MGYNVNKKIRRKNVCGTTIYKKKKEIIAEEKKGEVYKKFKNVFSDGELVEILKKD